MFKPMDMKITTILSSKILLIWTLARGYIYLRLSSNSGPEVKTFFMLNSTEHEFSTAHKNKDITAFKLSDGVFITCCHFNIYKHDKFCAQLS